MNRLIDLTGQRFARLIVLERGENSMKGKARWVCACACGQITTVIGLHLRNGNTSSCGCLRRERAVEHSPYQLVHGHARGGRETSEYKAWRAMLERCDKPTHHAYRNYGGRGITVCERWQRSFQAFLDDVGLKPSPDLSIDRINNDGNYEPGNVRWATLSQQRNNRRHSAQA